MADQRSERANAAIDQALTWGETGIYAVVALLLLGGAGVLLGEAITAAARDLDGGVINAMTGMLSTLLLVFVFVELLSATRATIRERRLVAEPFLLVGIIASIKEIVLVAGAEDTKNKPFDEFRDAMVEIGALAGVIIVLSVSALLLRVREREPSETDH
jgi:uncharacterized membrane protein (DUF373 family)